MYMRLFLVHQKKQARSNVFISKVVIMGIGMVKIHIPMYPLRQMIKWIEIE